MHIGEKFNVLEWILYPGAVVRGEWGCPMFLTEWVQVIAGCRSFPLRVTLMENMLSLHPIVKTPTSAWKIPLPTTTYCVKKKHTWEQIPFLSYPWSVLYNLHFYGGRENIMIVSKPQGKQWQAAKIAATYLNLSLHCYNATAGREKVYLLKSYQLCFFLWFSLLTFSLMENMLS